MVLCDDEVSYRACGVDCTILECRTAVIRGWENGMCGDIGLVHRAYCPLSVRQRCTSMLFDQKSSHEVLEMFVCH